MAFGTSTEEHTENLKLPRQAALQTDPACPTTSNLTSRLKPGQRVPHFSDSLIKLKSDGFFFNRHWIITWGRNHHGCSSHSWNELRLTIMTGLLRPRHNCAEKRQFNTHTHTEKKDSSVKRHRPSKRPSQNQTLTCWQHHTHSHATSCLKATFLTCVAVGVRKAKTH